MPLALGLTVDLARSVFYRSYNASEHSERETFRFEKPNRELVAGMKHANYDKVSSGLPAPFPRLLPVDSQLMPFPLPSWRTMA